jgi:hypothetical protein
MPRRRSRNGVASTPEASARRIALSSASSTTSKFSVPSLAKLRMSAGSSGASSNSESYANPGHTLMLMPFPSNRAFQRVSRSTPDHSMRWPSR